MVGVTLMAWLCCAAAAAGDTGRIAGDVLDPSGAVISGSHIVLRNTNTGAQLETLSKTTAPMSSWLCPQAATTCG